MGLIIKHNRADHTHENEQFRRIAKALRLVFNELKWDGLLIGNPFNDSYSRFRPDGLLLYNHGLIIIDLKSYSGIVQLPPNKREFESTAWYAESNTDKKRIHIKAGNRFINPFKQLDSYRNTFKEIVSNELSLKGCINEYRTCALNIFSGPLSIHNSIPKEIPYYKITQEKDLATMLYDYSSENSFSEDLANSLCSIFNAEEWKEHIEMPTAKNVDERTVEIDSNVELSISSFLKNKDSGVLILESMDSKDRDSWVEYILSQSQEYELPQVETWIHSARIARKVSMRMGIELQSLYNTIYGGSPKSTKQKEVPDEGEDVHEEHLQEIIPIRSDDFIDDAAVIILHEAHLVSRSLHQSDLLRFGTGRLLEDLLTFLNQSKTNRKLICIGDPYSLTYGTDTDSAINSETISESFLGKIVHYRKPPASDPFQGKLGFRLGTANGIEQKRFNNLSFPWHKNDLTEITKAEISNYLISWFGNPIDSEPSKTVMVFTNKDAKKINLWIKNHALKNGKSLAISDLLILNNNITIPDETGFSYPTKLFNGMFLLVKSVGETISKTVSIRQSTNPVILNFTKVRVTCLSTPNRLETDLFILDNYFYSEEGLSKEEQIAFRVFVNQLVNAQTKENPFNESIEYNQLHEDDDYIRSLRTELDLQKRLELGDKVKTKFESQLRETRKIVRGYKRRFRNRLLSVVTKNDPFVNAGQVHYGWALTVHKCIGSTFSQAIINAFQGENRGIANANYYRWLYTAATTTTNNLFVANPQIVNPLMDTRFEDTDSVNSGDEKTKKQLLTFSGYEINESFIDKFPQQLNENVIGAICELSLNLSQHGILLESVIANGDYLTKALYSLPTNNASQAIIAINNKGQKDNWSVSSIRIERSNSELQVTINNEIQNLFKTTYESSSSTNLELPQDFRKPIYQHWKNLLLTKGFKLNLIEAHKNQDIFSITGTKNESIKIRVWYGDDGFIRKIIVLQKSSSELGENLKNWLLNGKKA